MHTPPETQRPEPSVSPAPTDEVTVEPWHVEDLATRLCGRPTRWIGFAAYMLLDAHIGGIRS